MPKRYSLVLQSLTLLALIALFFARGLIYIDPDFGWHLRMGQTILQQGIPRHDPFSYSMPSFEYIDHEWLSDVLIALTYQLMGIPGPAMLYTIIPILALLTVIPLKARNWAIFPLLLTAPILFSFAGIRPQLITWLFFAILYKLISDPAAWTKYRVYLPALFLVWANLHGGFLIGLVLLVFNELVRIWRSRQLDPTNLLIVLASIVFTFVNPYSFSLWWETFMESWLLSTNAYLKFGIDEWTPLTTRFSATLALYLITSIALFLKFHQRFNLIQKGLYLGLLLAAISVRRHLPLWLLVSLPLYAYGLSQIVNEKWLNRPYLLTQKRRLILAFFICFSFFFIHSRIVMRESFDWDETHRYPLAAVTFLKAQPPPARMLAPYTWAGYLLWKLPSQKVFVDGRMATWIANSPPNESNWAYRDFNDFILGRTDASKFLEKYHIQTVLWITQNEKSSKMIANLKNLGWTRIYGDPNAVIYQQPRPL